VPVYEITAAIQSDRKSGSPSGAHGDSPWEAAARLSGNGLFSESAISLFADALMERAWNATFKRPLSPMPGSREEDAHTGEKD